MVQFKRLRTHIHGDSNRKSFLSQSLQKEDLLRSTDFELRKSLYTSELPLPKTPKKQFKEMHSKRELTKNRSNSQAPHLQADSQLMKTESKLKSMFRSKYNIKRIVKGWKMCQKGALTPQQLKTFLKERFQLQINSQQATKLTDKYSTIQPGKINTEDLVSMLFQPNTTYFLRPSMTQLSSGNSSVTKKISDLLGSNVSEDSEKTFKTNLLNRNSSLGNVNSIYKNHFPRLGSSILENWTSSTSTWKQPQINRRENTSLTWNQNTSGLKTNSYLTTKMKSFEYDPRQMQKIDQGKTRLGATPVFRKVDQNLLKLRTDQVLKEKQKVDQTLQAERQLIKSRYLNKLEKIRRNRESEVENIARIDSKFEQTEEANLKKRRLETQAYNYTAFVGNNWR